MKKPKFKKENKMNETNINEVTIDGVLYIRKDKQNKKAEELNGMKYCIVRTYSAGVFAGYIESRIGTEIVLKNVRRIWYWDGAASLSQLAVDGTSKPENCKFPCEVEKIELLQVIEIIECTEKSKKSIESVEIWKQ